VSRNVGKNTATIGALAKEGITLLYPGPKELADRMPTGPQAGEKMLIVTDVRSAKACPGCKEFQLIPQDALAKIFLHLYGPEGTGQIRSDQIQTITFHDLKRYVVAREENKAPPDPAVVKYIKDARWIFFAMLDVDTAEYPDSDALSRFLRLPSEERDKKLVVLSYSAPYYLDQTEISKLTAYFAVYSKVAPFLEASVRAIYHEFAPVGHSPVSISALNYDLIDVTAPDPGQIIKIIPLSKAEGEGSPQQPANIKVGSTLELATAPILDHNGTPVPDGTPVVFRLMYPAESLELPQHESTTVNGVARTTVKLEREGELYITASSGEARKSTTLVITITGGKSGVIATLVPKPTPTNTPTPTATPTATPSPSPYPTPSGPTGEVAPPRKRRVDFVSLLAALLGVAIAGGMGFDSRKQDSIERAVSVLLKSVIVGMLVYVLYGLGALPGASWMQHSLGAWGAALVAFVGGMIPVMVGW
jgi:beta-N-acetylhexosaminidase